MHLRNLVTSIAAMPIAKAQDLVLQIRESRRKRVEKKTIATGSRRSLNRDAVLSIAKELLGEEELNALLNQKER